MSGQPPRRRPRQSDIARRAGVSQATVSMVINAGPDGHGQISPATAQRVWDAVRELGYVANPAARSLAGGRVGLLGVYTFEPVFPVDSHDFYHPFLMGIEEGAQKAGVDVVLFTSATGPDGHRTIFREGVNRLAVADGCVLLGHAPDPSELEQLASSGYPMVFVGRRELGDVEVSWVGADYARATSDVVERLHDLGHERLVYLAWTDANEPTVDRLHGYRAARNSVGAEPDDEIRRLTDDQVDQDLLTGLRDDGVTAVVVQDVVFAQRLATAGAGMGVSIPGDLSVAVLGDPPRGRAVQDWSGFIIPRRAMGSRALAALADRVESRSDEVTQELLPCRWHPGDTVAPLA